MPTIAAWMLLLLYPAFSVLSWRAKLTKCNQQLKGGLVGVLIVPYWLAVNGRPSWPEMLSLVVYIALPILLLRWSARQLILAGACCYVRDLSIRLSNCP